MIIAINKVLKKLNLPLIDVYLAPALFDAITAGSAEEVTRLINEGASVQGMKTYKGSFSPLTQALFLEQFKIAEILLNHGADPYDKSADSFMGEYLPIQMLFLKAKNIDDDTYGFVRSFIAKGYDPNDPDNLLDMTKELKSMVERAKLEVLGTEISTEMVPQITPVNPPKRARL